MEGSLENQKKFGSSIRTQGGQGNGKMTNLVYDPITGTFIIRPLNAPTSHDELVVTDMTREGFALEMQQQSKALEIQKKMGEDIRVQGGLSSGKMTELIFDTVTGNFITVAQGTISTNQGAITNSQEEKNLCVTAMTKGGFAATIAYVSKEDLVEFCNSSDESMVGRAYEWEGENVFHFHLKPLLHSFGKEYSVLFIKGNVPEKFMNTFVVSIREIDNDILAEIFSIEENGVKCALEVNYIPAKTELYSRSKGLLEVNVLKDKRVMIVGLGSFGSQIAIELAKAGIGSFSLFDFDRVELHNLARHTATLQDLGRLKTDVIGESIKGKNPYAIVEKFPVDINGNLELLESEVEKSDLVICATDNNQSRFKMSSVLVKKQKIGIFGRAVTRAEGGDVFRYVPGGPCYCCLIGNENFRVEEEITNEASARRNGEIPAYASAQDVDAMVQVGLSADIEPICNMMVKLTLMELSRGTESGISCLEEELIYPYYMWANRRERRHVNWAPMPSAGNMPTIMRWYGAIIPRNEECALCSRHVWLDSGEDFSNRYGDKLMKQDWSNVTLQE